jgi:hypothetical protein
MIGFFTSRIDYQYRKIKTIRGWIESTPLMVVAEDRGDLSSVPPSFGMDPKLSH